MPSILAKPSLHHRQSSKSNSTSSSSTVTAQLATPMGSKNPTYPAVRSASPTGTTGSAVNLSSSTLSPDVNRRSSITHSRSSSVNGITEGIGNLNRWSQSTGSSKSSATAHNRRNSFARRLSGSFGSFGAFATSQSPPASRSVLQKARPSPGNSPQRAASMKQPSNPPAYLPPTMKLPPLPQTTEPAYTPSTGTAATPVTTAVIFTPATNTSMTPDYFGEKWSNRSPQMKRKAVPRIVTTSTARAAPKSTGNSVRENTKHSQSHHSLYRNGSPQSSRLDSPEKSRDQEQRSRSGHSRNRDDPGKGSGGTEGESSASSAPSQRESKRRGKIPSQKAMLSKALAKANHAVLLDNAQNFEGAMDAYGDACDLLLRVMSHSHGEEDRKKLEAIRHTYQSRINELQSSELASFTMIDSKALPDRPMSIDSKEQDTFSPITDDDDEAVVETATMTQAGYNSDQRSAPTFTREQLPPRRQSLMPFTFSQEDVDNSLDMGNEKQAKRNVVGSDITQDQITQTTIGLAPPMDKEYMPPPLSPRRPLTPDAPHHSSSTTGQSLPPRDDAPLSHHVRQETAESTSWLDTIDESGGSSASSVHSRSNSIGISRKRIRAPSDVLQNILGDAFDAAIEAAYGDGLEPIGNEDLDAIPTEVPEETAGIEYVSDARRNVNIAKQRVREAEREQTEREVQRDAFINTVKNQEKARLQEKAASRARTDSLDIDYGADESEDEERILDEVTSGFILDDTEYDLQSKSALPWQSDSSGFSGRTWGSSVESNSNTVGTTLSTVAEISTLPWSSAQSTSKPPPPVYPPPSGALPPPPSQLSAASTPVNAPISDSSRPTSPSAVPLGVRERRLSGQKVRQLKIDTNTRLPSDMTGPKTQPPSFVPPVFSTQLISEPPKSATLIRESQQLLPSSTFKPFVSNSGSRQISSPLPASNSSDMGKSVSPATPSSNHTSTIDDDNSVPPMKPSPERFPGRGLVGPGMLKKNFSSASLKTTKLPMPTFDESPVNPIFPVNSQLRNGTSALEPGSSTPTNSRSSIKEVSEAEVSFLETDIHDRSKPGFPNTLHAKAPMPLEPCPESFLQRPFWFLRVIHNALSHPAGAYFSTRLFVPRDMWLVANPKLKGIDDKIANCDYLTANLLKLAKVDTLDADAVLEEMQSFEMVMDQVQSILSKKLGSEVGVNHTVYKPDWLPDDVVANPDVLSAKSVNTATKYLSTWRKLRSKTSERPMPLTSYNAVNRDSSRDTLTMRSLPMTKDTKPRFAKRDPSKQVQGCGPNLLYMRALGRLCDAAQVIDQIARQVEDPGLKHSSQTQVGLELSTRHAAEFFALYVCAWVTSDFGKMLDKYIKRKTESVNNVS